MKIKLSFVIPCYDEQDNIRPMYDWTSTVLRHSGFSYELIFVNDGSRDSTLRVLRELADTQPFVRVIHFSRNFGKEAAIFAGIHAAKGEYITLIDADLQQSPEVALHMVALLDANPDLDCVAAYQKQRHEGVALNIYKRIFYSLINRVAEVKFVNGASDFRTFRRSMAQALLSMGEYHRFSKGLFSWVGFQTEYIPYEANARQSGKTKFSLWKLLKLAIDGIVAFTTAPLRIATAAGGITAGLSLLYLLVVVLQKLLRGIAVPGYATIVVLILFLGGLQLLFLGIIGEYLARTYIQAKNRPICIIKEEINSEQQAD